MNREIKNYFKKAFKNNTLFQAYLFCGPVGTGKYNVVEFLKEKFIKNKDNFIHLQPLEEKNEITIEQIRNLIKNISYKEKTNNKKLVLISQASKMNLSAANSLLKILEEPNRNVFFILLSDQEESLLPTIRSRCHKIFFHPKSASEIKQHLKIKFKNKDDHFLEEASMFSRGCYIEAEKIVNNPEILKDKRQEFNDFRQAIKGSWNEGISLAELLTKEKGSKESLVVKIDYWIWSLGDYLKSEISRCGNISIQKKIHWLIRELLVLRKRIKQSNANEKLQLENFFIQAG